MKLALRPIEWCKVTLQNSSCSITEGSYATDPDGSSRILEYRCDPLFKIAINVRDVQVYAQSARD